MPHRQRSVFLWKLIVFDDSRKSKESDHCKGGKREKKKTDIRILPRIESMFVPNGHIRQICDADQAILFSDRQCSLRKIFIHGFNAIFSL